MLTKLEIRNFLIERKGYLKKSPIETAKAIWKNSSKNSHPKNSKEMEKELATIKEVLTDLRQAKEAVTTEKEQQILDVYNKIIEQKNKPKKRLFYDIEVSPNIVFSWRIGYNLNLSPENIIKERAIICICWKWEGNDKVHSLKWNNGCDKEMLTKFAKVIDSADEVIGQNSDRFDNKWVRTRCIFHDIPVSNKFNSIDTLKMAKSGFLFNSNKLDYMGKYLGLGGKLETTYDLWKDICLDNCKKAMNYMVEYCKKDVIQLENVYHKLEKFSPPKKFKYKIR